MGGGHVSRPDFGMPQPDAAYPLTEFYLLAQQALEKSGSFMLPALYAGLQAPARRIWSGRLFKAVGCFSSTPKPNFVPIFTLSRKGASASPTHSSLV